MVVSEPGGEIVVHRHSLLLPVPSGQPAASHLCYEHLARDPTGCQQNFLLDLRQLTPQREAPLGGVR